MVKKHQQTDFTMQTVQCQKWLRKGRFERAPSPVPLQPPVYGAGQVRLRMNLATKEMGVWPRWKGGLWRIHVIRLSCCHTACRYNAIVTDTNQHESQFISLC